MKKNTKIEMPPVGSRWKDNDPRIERTVVVIGVTTRGKVWLKNEKNNRRTSADPERFNGKSHGYTRIDA